MADRLSASGRLGDALTLLDAMSSDDRRRPEVAFARAVLLIDLGRPAEAERLLARLIDDKPDVTRIRLEHGRALAAMGRPAAAERELRRALADNPPPAVVANVDTALRGIRASRRLFGTVSGGLAPDTNINQATSADQLDMFGLPFEIDPSARRRSGVGVLAHAEVGFRQSLVKSTALVARINGSARIYPSAATDDVVVEGRLGLEQLTKTSRITPELTYLKRWYAGQAYAHGPGVGVRFEHRLSRAWFASAIVDVRHLDYDRYDAFDGWASSLRLQADHPLGAATVLSLGLTGTRTGARDKAYASWLGEADIGLFRDWKGGWSTSVSLAGGRLVADEAMVAFGTKRDDWRIRGSLSLANRKISWLGLMPSLRLSREHYASKVDLYDIDRTRAEILVTRTF